MSFKSTKAVGRILAGKPAHCEAQLCSMLAVLVIVSRAMRVMDSSNPTRPEANSVSQLRFRRCSSRRRCVRGILIC